MSALQASSDEPSGLLGEDLTISLNAISISVLRAPGNTFNVSARRTCGDRGACSDAVHKSGPGHFGGIVVKVADVKHRDALPSRACNGLAHSGRLGRPGSPARFAGLATERTRTRRALRRLAQCRPIGQAIPGRDCKPLLARSCSLRAHE